MIIDPKEVSTGEFHGYLLGAVSPRPIALVSTLDKDGNVNLSPFSFFNCFSANPPILVFSPARRVRDNTTKHTLDNVYEVPEAVISIVSYEMVQQVSLSSTEYDRGVNEFIKSGLTEMKSHKVKPPMVKEAKASFECRVNEVIPLGENAGAGSLVVCEVVVAHIDDSILDENGKINPFKLDVVGRMGGDWYNRAAGDSLFKVPKPIRTKGIGVDNIPEIIRESSVLTGNDLGQLGNVEALPDKNEILDFGNSAEIAEIQKEFDKNSTEKIKALHVLAKNAIEANDVKKAWLTLLQEY